MRNLMLVMSVIASLESGACSVASRTTTPEPPTSAEGGEGAMAGVLPRFEPLDACFVQSPDDLDIELDVDCGYAVVPEFHGALPNATLVVFPGRTHVQIAGVNLCPLMSWCSSSSIRPRASTPVASRRARCRASCFPTAP